jgi:hypothetical protein
MSITINVSPEEQATYEAQARAEGLSVQEWLRKVAREKVQISPQLGGPEDRPIWDVIVENMKDVPPEEFAKLPPDSAAQVDHYLYGHPKQ